MKKLIIMGLLVVLLAYGVAATTETDDFNRANNNVIGNGWSEDETAASDIKILDNYAYIDKTVANVKMYRPAFNNVTNFSFMFRHNDNAQEFDIKLSNAAGNLISVYLYTLDNNLNCHELGLGKKAVFNALGSAWYHVSVSQINNATRRYNVTVNGTTTSCEMFSGNYMDYIQFVNLGTGLAHIDDFQQNNETDPNAPPIVTVVYPIASTSYGDALFNDSIVLSTDKAANCSINYTSTIISNLTSHTFYLPSTPDGNYTVAYACNSSAEWTNSTFWFFYDGTAPTLSLGRPVNGTTMFGDFNLSLAFYDTHLFQTNVTIINSTGHLVYWNSSGDITTGQNNWTINEYVNTSFQVLEVESYTAFFEATDSHTAHEFLEELIVIKDDDDPEYNQLEYDLSRGDITLEYPKDMDIITTKEGDRFVLKFYSETIRGETAFNIQGPKMVYLPGSEYQGHFVIFGKDDKAYYWFDTEGLEMTRIEEVKPNKYRIYFIQDEDYETSRSLGGLNYRNWTTTFSINIGDGRAIITPVGQELQGAANISKPKTHIIYTWYKDGVNVSFGNFTTNSTDLVSVNNYTLIDVGTYIFSVRSWNGSEYTPWINSTPFLTGYINANFYDEESLGVVDYVEITAELVGLNVNYSEVKKTSNGSVQFDEFGLTNDTIYEIRYYATDHIIRSGFIDMSNFGNATLSLYMLNDTVSDKLDVIVRDFSLIGIPNATATIQRFYANITAWLTIAQGRTNVLGYTRQYVNKDDVYYRFSIEYEGTTIFTTSGEIITADTTVYRITTDISSVYTSWGTIDGNIWYSNATGTPTFSVVYENKLSTIESVSLEVFQTEEEGGQTTLLSTNTSTAAEDTITIIITDPFLYHFGLVRVNYDDNTYNYLEDVAEYSPPPPAEKEDMRQFVIIAYIILFPALILGGMFITKRLLSVPITVVICSLIAHFNPLWSMFPLWTLLIITFGALPVGWYLNKVNV